MAGWLGLAALAPPAADAQTVPAPGTPAPVQVLVSGARAALATAARLEQQALGVVDAVVADDIAHLPDLSVAEALQRLPGVQITRDRGEAGVLTLRGLGQVQTLVDGREWFTAGSARTLDLSDMPAELLAAAVVHKTASASQIEGGLAGTIDLRTRRPLDLGRTHTQFSAHALHGDLAGHTRGQFGLLASRSGVFGGQRLGLLLHASLQDRAWREDQKSTGAPGLRTDLLPGRSLVVPASTSETTSIGTRRRQGLQLVAQWQPTAGLDLTAQASHLRLRTRQDSHQLNASASRQAEPGSVRTFDGTDDVAQVTWLQAPLSALSFARDTEDRIRHVALAFDWRRAGWRWQGDLSRIDSRNTLFFSGPFLAAVAPRFTHDLSSTPPGTSTEGIDLAMPGPWRYTGLAYRWRPFDGRLDTLRLDAEHRLDRGGAWWLQMGLRHADRRADNDTGLVFGDIALSGLAAADRPGQLLTSPYGLLPGTGVSSLGPALIGRLDDARDPQALRQVFGIDTLLPASGNALGAWQVRERTDAGHLVLRGALRALALDGELGLRAVRTHEQLDGTQSLPASGGLAPIRVDHRYTDWLPSLQLRQRAGPAATWRLALSRTLTRPNFDQLSPSLSLLRNSIDPSLNQGAAGNPQLAPVRARNVDLALDQTLGRGSLMSMALFWKRVDGFVTTVSAPETHDGVVYQVSRPQNADRARVRGAELALQHLFPAGGPWAGYGLQANYTLVDSKTLTQAQAQRLPLQNLSRHSANLVLLYEQGGFGARLAVNTRSRYLAGLSTVVGLGTLPVYLDGYRWVDASLRWRWSDRVTVSLEGGNLTRTLRRAYHELPTRPQGAWLNDRQLGLGVSVQL